MYRPGRIFHKGIAPNNNDELARQILYLQNSK